MRICLSKPKTVPDALCAGDGLYKETTMKIIIAPAKKMVDGPPELPHIDLPRFLRQAQVLAEHIRSLSYGEAKAMWCCGDPIAKLNYERHQRLDLRRNLTPAILAYRGVQYTQMAPGVFDYAMLDYIQKNLRILSGLYGVLRPFDGVRAYRLEMQAQINMGPCANLYQFWGAKIAQELFVGGKTILNLASKEYSRCVSDYLTEDIRFVTCRFGRLRDGRLVEQGTQVKIARGEMVRFLAENKIEDIEALKAFDRLGYVYESGLSSRDELVFVQY